MINQIHLASLHIPSGYDHCVEGACCDMMLLGQFALIFSLRQEAFHPVPVESVERLEEGSQ